MTPEILKNELEKRLLACGYERVGIISLEKMNGFSERYAERLRRVPESRDFYSFLGDASQIRARHPWAKTMVVCTYYYGQYRYPEQLQGHIAKAFALDLDEDFQKRKLEFEEWMTEEGIRFDGEDTGPLRYAAVMSGLGIFRRNNFFYTEKGSYYALSGYLLGAECEELTYSPTLKPCSEHCTLCIDACPTAALLAPYTLNPLKCISYLTFGTKGVIPDDMPEESIKEWICGCDDCQDACPYNRIHDWSKGMDYKGLAELAPYFTPEGVLAAEESFLDEHIESISAWHLFRGDVPVLKINAGRALRNAARGK